MEITVDVSNVSLESTVGGSVVLSGHTDDEYPDSRARTLGDAVAERIADEIVKDDAYKTLRREVLALRTEEVRARLEPMIAEAITMPLRRTNQFGEPFGQETTLRELIIAEVGDLLAKPGRGGNVSLLQKTVRDEVNKALREDLAGVVAEEKAKLIAAMHEGMANLLTEAVQRGLRA